jgi:hypothetical protein
MRTSQQWNGKYTLGIQKMTIHEDSQTRVGRQMVFNKILGIWVQHVDVLRVTAKTRKHETGTKSVTWTLCKMGRQPPSSDTFFGCTRTIRKWEKPSGKTGRSVADPSVRLGLLLLLSNLIMPRDLFILWSSWSLSCSNRKASPSFINSASSHLTNTRNPYPS